MSAPIVVLYSKSKKGWKSCLEIEKDLLAIYKKNFGTKVVFKIYESDGSPVAKLAKQIEILRPGHIVFLSHRSHPTPLLRALGLLKLQKTSFHFYLYGNWPQLAGQWLEAKVYLKMHSTDFIVPSKTLANEVRKMFTASEATVTEISFPVRVEKFRFNQKVRNSNRRRLGVGPKEKAILFAGDLRDGKGASLSIDMVLQNFVKNPTLHFWICGSQNAVDPKYWRGRFRDARAVMGDRFSYFGKVPQSKLADLMRAADVFLLPSRYEFEVFGLTPIEAMSSGLPCVLSNWRGFNEIKIKDSSLFYLEVPQKKPDSKISTAKAAKVLAAALSKTATGPSRTKNFKALKGAYSKNSCAAKVKGLFKN